MVKEKSPQTKSAAEAAYKGAFGYKPSEKIEKFEKLITQLHFVFKQTAEQIAETIDMSVEEIQQIIERYRAVNQ
jgi:DNA-directed RNA polymerase specialized sigma subunit